jgi:hypothetical protein
LLKIYLSLLILNGRFPFTGTSNPPYTCIRTLRLGPPKIHSATIVDYAILTLRDLHLVSICTVLEDSHLQFSDHEAMMINLQSSPLPYTPPPPPHPRSTRILYNMNTLSDPRVPPALVSTLTADLPQFHHDFNTFDHLYTHNLLPLQAYLNHDD